MKLAKAAENIFREQSARHKTTVASLERLGQWAGTSYLKINPEEKWRVHETQISLCANSGSLRDKQWPPGAE